MILYREIETPLGIMTIASGKGGIVLASFSAAASLIKDNTLPGFRGEPAESGNDENLEVLAKEISDYFQGTLKEFSVQTDPSGTPFQKEVWDELRKIPFGSTSTYARQAQIHGNPDAIRAIAAANGANPVAVVIPCHRVIGSDGNLTGYAGGLWRKKWLIDHEQKFSGGASYLSLF